MTEERIERVAELLATVGGSWYPERTRPALRSVNNRHRDVARLILGVLERESEKQGDSADDSVADEARGSRPFNFAEGEQLYVGATVAYRPPGEKRAIICRIESMDHGRVYLVPVQQNVGWVSIHTLVQAGHK
ncbi:hypothetical protein [Microvirga puerhi]|uniref:Uncharacterized protein n=1 Tax=Microvirga puerhi TaxID=2876078 RepID=A0ABS7VSA0_9HYPH|nr:hypothetical protein [Microvirga puerhi]MBZ6078410.1 hypothetical protein [Microvirga puerhi]